jgi:hypothetical protein
VTFKKFMTAAAAIGLAVSSTGAVAGSGAEARSLAPATETVEGSQVDGEWGVEVWIIAAVVVGVVLWLLLDDDDKDEPVSP